MPLICHPSGEWGGWEVWGLEGLAPDGGVLLRFFPHEIMVCGLLTCKMMKIDVEGGGLGIRLIRSGGVVVLLEEVTAIPAWDVLQAILEQLPAYPWEGKVCGCPIVVYPTPEEDPTLTR